MCNYVDVNKCKITNEVCPWMYFCDKQQVWKVSAKMTDKCKVAEINELPNGCYKVVSERKGYLYIDMGDNIIKLPNPYDNVPLYVKLTKTKTGEYKIKKEK